MKKFEVFFWLVLKPHNSAFDTLRFHTISFSSFIFSDQKKRERERDRMIVCMREREREVKLLLQCFVSVSGGENEPEIHRCCCISKANHLDLGGHRIVQISKKMVQDHQNDFKQFSTTHTHTLYLYLSHTHTHTHTL